MPPRVFYTPLVVGLLATGCGVESHRLSFVAEREAATAGQRDSGADLFDAGADEGDSSAPEECPDAGRLPATLACTGLFADVVKKKLAPGVMPFTPSSPLWSDGAEKSRWIYLPPGEKIDTSEPGTWKFPVGTKAWKEFRVDGRRVETRIMHKVRDRFWWRGTYAWNEDETEATFHFGGEDIPIEGGSYYLPDRGECDDCHEGQFDRLLGFEAVSLGLPGAKGMTLAQLAEDGWLSDVPDRVELSLGDDGTGMTQALALLHINCGVSCHNDGPNATANLTGLNLKLDPSLLDGQAPNEDWPVVRTALGIPAKGAQWGRVIRIAPGAPADSLVVQLMSNRTDAAAQMPPIASRVVDEAGLSLVKKWISALGETEHAVDAAVSSGDAGTDADVAVVR